ncbi:MAG: AAA family ATPase [Thermodesulfovibrionia bacterium]|nr:AAA family ATPase [Thermodesulfovibrionia bacterium]
MPKDTSNSPAVMPDRGKILILMCGLMGSGKSTIAKGLSKRFDAALIRSDEVRKELAGIKAGEHRYEAFGKGIYSEEFFNKTYEALFKKADQLLESGQSVIIDASFKKTVFRQEGEKLARAHNSLFLVVETRCPDEEAKSRLNERTRSGKDVSDGRWEILKKQKADFEKVIELSSGEHVLLDTKDEINKNLDKVDLAIKSLSI